MRPCLDLKLLASGDALHHCKSSVTCTCDIPFDFTMIFSSRNIQEFSTLGFRTWAMAAAGAAMGFGKKAALAAAGLFSGVGGAVAYKLDQVMSVNREHPEAI